MTAYYNENDPKAAAWLRELIARGHIAPGVVDERSIEDVTADDLAGFVQCHFFAGIGVWSYALRLAGWPDDRPVWTGSCPCQPFSLAGKRKGTSDERHLWPAWFWLIDQCRPRIVFGEQVSSKDGLGWLDIVSADLEGAGYAIGALDSCAAGVGAPHIRQRLYFGAERLADADDARRSERQRNDTPARYWNTSTSTCGDDRLERTGPTNGFWRDADWLFCRDGQWRPVESGTFPLAHGAPNRVVKLRGYGGGLVATHAAALIEAFDAVTATQPAE